MLTVDAQTQRLPKILGQHTRIGLPFRWTIGGQPVDLAAGAYTAEAWVKKPDGEITGPHPVSISGQVATYLLSVDDLDTPSPSDEQNTEVVVVAKSNENTLVSDVREIVVGSWGGADQFSA